MRRILYQNEFKPSFNHICQPMETRIRYIKEGPILKQQVVQIPSQKPPMIEYIQEGRQPVLKQQIIQIPYKKPRIQLISKPKTIKPRKESFYHFSFPSIPLPHTKHISGYGHGIYSNIFTGFGVPTYSPYYIPPTNHQVIPQAQQNQNVVTGYTNPQSININGLMNGYTFQTNYPNYVASKYF